MITQIFDKKEAEGVKFGDLEIGQLFQLAGSTKLYMKIPHVNHPAVNMQTGQLKGVTQDCPTIKRKGNIMLTE